MEQKRQKVLSMDDELNKARRVLFGKDYMHKNTFLRFDKENPSNKPFKLGRFTFKVNGPFVYLKIAYRVPNDDRNVFDDDLILRDMEWVNIGTLTANTFIPSMPNFTALMRFQIVPERWTVPRLTTLEQRTSEWFVDLDTGGNNVFIAEDHIETDGNQRVNLRWNQRGILHSGFPVLWKGNVDDWIENDVYTAPNFGPKMVLFSADPDHGAVRKFLVTAPLPIERTVSYIKSEEEELRVASRALSAENAKPCYFALSMWRSDDVRLVCEAHAHFVRMLRNVDTLEQFWSVQSISLDENALKSNGIREIEFWHISPERQLLVDLLWRNPHRAATRLRDAQRNTPKHRDSPADPAYQAARKWTDLQRTECIVCDAPNAGFIPAGGHPNLRLCSLACYAYCK